MNNKRVQALEIKVCAFYSEDAQKLRMECIRTLAWDHSVWNSKLSCHKLLQVTMFILDLLGMLQSSMNVTISCLVLSARSLHKNNIGMELSKN